MSRSFNGFVLRGLTALAVAGFLGGAIGGVAYAAGTDNRGAGAGASASAPAGPSASAPAGPPGSLPATSRASTGAPAGGTGTAATGSRSATGSAHSAASGGSGAGRNGAGGHSSGGNGTTPPGNKGHIQIEGVPDCGPTPCGNDNDPHVGCTLNLQLFGYPSGVDSAVVTITGQAPSGSGSVLTDSFTFDGATSPNGSTLDSQRPYSLTGPQLAADGLTLQPQQGYHLRIEVSVNGEPAKTHVIWFQPCSTAPVLPGSSASAVMPGDTTSADAGLTGTPQPLAQATPTLGTTSTTISTAPRAATGNTAVDASVVGALDAALGTSSGADSQTPDAPPVASAALASSAAHPHLSRGHASGILAFTGADILVTLAVGALIVAVGMTLVSISRRRARPVSV